MFSDPILGVSRRRHFLAAGFGVYCLPPGEPAMTSPRLAFSILAASLALAACQPGAPSSQEPVASDAAAEPDSIYEREPDELEEDALLAEAGTPHQVVAEAFSSVDVPEDNVDS